MAVKPIDQIYILFESLVLYLLDKGGRTVYGVWGLCFLDDLSKIVHESGNVDRGRLASEVLLRIAYLNSLFKFPLNNS